MVSLKPLHKLLQPQIEMFFSQCNTRSCGNSLGWKTAVASSLADEDFCTDLMFLRHLLALGCLTNAVIFKVIGVTFFLPCHVNPINYVLIYLFSWEQFS